MRNHHQHIKSRTLVPCKRLYITWKKDYVRKLTSNFQGCPATLDLGSGYINYRICWNKDKWQQLSSGLAQVQTCTKKVADESVGKARGDCDQLSQHPFQVNTVIAPDINANLKPKPNMQSLRDLPEIARHT